MAIFVPKEKIDETLSTTPAEGEHLVEPLKAFAFQTGFPAKILEDVRVQNEAEIHRTEGDLWQCLEGTVTFICGGELVDPWQVQKADGSEDANELKAKNIRGGITQVLKPGDWLWIPPGEPHQHSAEGVARLLIIKVRP